MSALARFRALHAEGSLLVLPNAWDAASARLVEREGARAVATSSAAVAWAHGEADGERLDEVAVVATVASIARRIEAPLTVDLERGYDDVPSRVAELVARVVDAGAVGVNLEDGAHDASLDCAKRLADKIAAVKARSDVFVNARTCLVLHGVAPERGLAEAILARARLFREAGADGLFVPRLVDREVVSEVAREARLPLNLMLDPRLPSQGELRASGVRRLSAGPHLALVALSAARRAARALLDGRSLDLGYPDVNALFSARGAASAGRGTG